MKCWWMFDAFFTFYVYSMDLFGAFDGFSIDTSWMFGRYSMNAPFHTSYLPLPISHFLFPMSMSLFDRRLPISHCRWPGLAECAERLNTASPLPGSAVWKHRTKLQKSEAVSASAKRSMRPSRIPPGHHRTTAFPPLFRTLLAAKTIDFLYILLYFAA